METKDWIKSKVGDRDVVVMEHLSKFIVWLGEHEHYFAAGPEDNQPVPIASSPKSTSAEDIKKSFLGLCREKLLAEMLVWNKLAEKMADEAAISGDCRVTYQDILDFLGNQYQVSPYEDKEGDK